MPHQRSSFDWKGFAFFARFALILVVGASATGAALRYAQSALQPDAASLLIASIPPAAAETFSSSTPQRILRTLTIEDSVPEQGKFIAADLVHMRLYLYENGTTTAQYPILTKGKPGTPWETPSGFYNIYTKEESHFSSIGHVIMPYSMQFYGNYFIHGWPSYEDGTPVASTYSGGCIRLATEDAQKVYEFADIHTKIFVYDPAQGEEPPSLSLGATPLPHIDANAYLVADIDNGDVYAEYNATQQTPITNATKLMTALVANEIISLDKKVSVQEGELISPQDTASTSEKIFLVNDLFYPLLMLSGDSIAQTLGNYYGKGGFVRWMNATARALDMSSSAFAEPSGDEGENVSTPEDLFRLASYLATKKSFVFKILQTKKATIADENGDTYAIRSHVSSTTQDSISIVTLKVGDASRRIAVITIGATATDTQSLAQWITDAAKSAQTACAACALPPNYRQISL